jgi:hypothetical protein
MRILFYSVAELAVTGTMKVIGIFWCLQKIAFQKDIEYKIHDELFPLSVKISSFINYTVVSEKDWEESPSYYSLYQSVLEEGIRI